MGEWLCERNIQNRANPAYHRHLQALSQPPPPLGPGPAQSSPFYLHFHPACSAFTPRPPSEGRAVGFLTGCLLATRGGGVFEKFEA